MSFRGHNPADVEVPFTETLAARGCGATAVHIGPCLIRRCRRRVRTLSQGTPRNRAKSPAFQEFSMQDHTPPSSLENAIAMQKYGVGQPVRRKQDDTLVRGKGKYTDDFNLPRHAYAWIVRSSPAHGIVHATDDSAAKT